MTVGKGSQVFALQMLNLDVEMPRKRVLGPLDQRKKVIRCENCASRKIKVRAQCKLHSITSDSRVMAVCGWDSL